VSKELEQLKKELDEAEKQKAVYQHRQERFSQREKYVRSAADRKRTHRLIQYGVAFEAQDKRMADFSEMEIFALIEKLFEIPAVKVCVEDAVRTHSFVTEGGES